MWIFFLPGLMTKIWRTAGKSWKHFLSVEPLHVKQQMETFGQERVVQGEQSGKYQCHKQTKALMSPTAHNAILSNGWMSHCKVLLIRISLEVISCCLGEFAVYTVSENTSGTPGGSCFMALRRTDGQSATLSETFLTLRIRYFI